MSDPTTIYEITCYDKSTGRILDTGTTCLPETLETGTVGVLVGVQSPSVFGHRVDLASKSIVPLPDRPDDHHEFDYQALRWVDPRTLAELKAAKNAAINAERLKANQSHFTFAGKQIATDPLSRSDIDGAHGIIVATGALPPGWPGGWKAMDNTICPIPDVPTWLAFYGTMVAQGTANFNHAQALKAQLAAATTPAEVEAVPDW